MNPASKEPQVGLLVSIEGNVGAGKSTLLDWFAGDKEVEILKEPVGLWESVADNNLLHMKYVDSQRWEFTFQIYADSTRILQLRDSQANDKVRLQERSLLTAHKIFCEIQKEAGAMSAVEGAVLESWYQNLAEVRGQVQVTPDLFIYLRTSPHTALNRMKARGREAESTVTLDYLTRVHEGHENLFIRDKHLLPSPVVVLDADIDEVNLAYLWVEAIAAIGVARSKKLKEVDLLEQFMKDLEQGATKGQH